MKKLKKNLMLLLVLVMCVSALAACKDKKKEEKETAKNSNTSGNIDISNVKLMNSGILSVGCEVGYPPFEDFDKDGTTPIGFDIDLINEVGKRLGLKVNIISTSFDGIFAGLGVNYDVVCSGCTITADRKKTMLFSTPYIKNYQAVVVAKDSKLTINSLKDLDKKSIALQKATTSDELMTDYKKTGTIDVEIVANEKVTSCFTQVLNGEVDAAVVDSTVADSYVAKNSDKFKIIFKDTTEPEEFGIAIKKDNTELQKAINEALAEMEKDGFIAETFEYWFGADAN